MMADQDYETAVRTRLRDERDRYKAESIHLRRVQAAVLRLHQAYRPTWTDEFDVCVECTRGEDYIKFPCRTRRELLKERP